MPATTKSTLQDTSRLRPSGGLIVFILITFLAPAASVFGMPGEWYASLNKPSWNPPSWIFGPVWTALYLMMALAAWLVWRIGGWKAQRKALSMYFVQLVLNAAWSPLFFGLKMPAVAFAEILLLLAAIIATAVVFTRISRPAGMLFYPYIAWVAFASFLNFTLWRMNS